MKKKGNSRWKIYMLIAVLLIAVAAWNIAKPYIDRYQSRKAYEELSEEMVEDTGKEKKKDWWFKDVKIAFDKLKKENEDIVAWIRFDDLDATGIDYPVLFSGDNQKYLRSDIYGNYHIAGCIFLDGDNRTDFQDPYSLIYGHRMKDNTMFGSLAQYLDYDFWKDNQYFTIYTDNMAYRYRIFASQEAPNRSDVFRIGYERNEVFKEFLDSLTKDSSIATGINPDVNDNILTLSTCTGKGYSKRMTVQAVCVDKQSTEIE